ncbi:MAG: nucleoside recognition domain-containing protein [Ignavibacteria bacterium]|jgi:spore maturation protein SpmA|nr:nucleoside recognition domain-containing protein [Ignavibacteria bacterium]
MLNYVWIALIILGIGTALYFDIKDTSENKFRNKEWIEFSFQSKTKNFNKEAEGLIYINRENFNQFYNSQIQSDVNLPAKVILTGENKGRIIIKINDASPEIWKIMAKASGEKDDLIGDFIIENRGESELMIKVKFEEVNFVKMRNVTNGLLDIVNTAVQIALGLIGIMALWLGVMKVAEEAGLIKLIAKSVKPITKFLFPDVPQDHPAMGSMIMNISANMLGLSNAATPFGLKAMEDLQTLNQQKDTATDAMCMFLAVNTAGLTLIPATAIAIRAAAGSSDPAIIIGTSVFGAGCATLTGITAAKIFANYPKMKEDFSSWIKSRKKSLSIIFSLILLVILSFTTGLGKILGQIFSFINPESFKLVIGYISILAIPLLIFSFLTYGLIKKVKVYEKFVEGAKEGFNVAVRIIPYLVAMLAAIGIFRYGGAMDLLVYVLTPVTNLIGMPAEALPMALMRPLSGSGSLGIMTEIIKTHGPDSLIGILVSTYYGSTETTFYVLAVYFGSVNIQKTRYALPVGLMADVAGILGATFIVNMLFR